MSSQEKPNLMYVSKGAYSYIHPLLPFFFQNYGEIFLGDILFHKSSEVEVGDRLTHQYRGQFPMLPWANICSSAIWLGATKGVEVGSTEYNLRNCLVLPSAGAGCAEKIILPDLTYK